MFTSLRATISPLTPPAWSFLLLAAASPLAAQPSQLQTLLVGGSQASCLYDGPPGGTFPGCRVDADGRFTLELDTDGARSVGRGTISSGPGVLRSGAWLDVSNLPFSVGAPSMFSRAALLEPVTFASTIRPARMDLRFLVNGAISHSHPQRFGSYGVLSLSTFFDRGRLEAFSDVVGGALGSRPLGSEFTQSFLVPSSGAFEMLFNLTAVARLDPPAGLAPSDRWSGSAVADFTNTLSITGARYFDDLGRDITSQVELRFGSGFVPPRIVPEPSAVLLLLAGVMGLGIRQRARHRAHARQRG